VARKRAGQKKDTLINIEETKEFVINVVTEELAQAMNLTSGEYAYEVDEFKVANLTPAPSDLIKAPRVAESPLNLECKLLQILEFGQFPTLTSFIIGEVLRVHIQEEVCADGVIKALKLKAIGRLGEDFYCKTRDIFEMKRPPGPF
jgi:flavin reductase (DIM6/NTAB) family NADH-FMN oxidoreductase RutF